MIQFDRLSRISSAWECLTGMRDRLWTRLRRFTVQHGCNPSKMTMGRNAFVDMVKLSRDGIGATTISDVILHGQTITVMGMQTRVDLNMDPHGIVMS